MDHLDNVALSTGSACHSDSVEISSVLKAMSVTKEAGKGAVRFSLGKYTTKEEIDHVLDKLETLRE